MSNVAAFAALVLAFGPAGAAFAQEEGFIPWEGGSEEAPADETPPPSPPPLPPGTSQPPVELPPEEKPAPPPRVEQRRVLREPQPEDFNRVSLYGAQPLGTLNRAIGVSMGFPLLGVRAGLGLHDRVDVGLGFDTFYGVMNEVRGSVRVNLLGDLHRHLTFQVEGGRAWFTQRPELELRGPRWITGRRNWNIEPGLVASFRGPTVQSARVFLDVRYHLALDTQPYAETPLGGVPPSVVVGHNVPVRMGAELPFSKRTSFLFVAGFDIHGRASDAPFMPTLSVGLVAGL